MINIMVKVNLFMKMEIIILENSEIIVLMEKVLYITRTKK